MVSGFEFFKGPWQDVEWLIDTTRKFYDEHVTPKGLGDMYTVAATRIMEHRNWSASKVMIEGNMDAVLRELNIFYVPKQVDPGPGLVFPYLDLYGKYRSGRFRPFYALEMKGSPVKYALFGQKALIGPTWFGNTDQGILRAARHKFVMLVEGPFDLLACRLLVPEFPVFSTGTKTVNDDHIAYLRMLGVNHVYLMFDNEDPSKEGEVEGAGNKAARIVANTYRNKVPMEFSVLNCPNNDPSQCLERSRPAKALKDQLEKILA